jgi:hypothetical protein
VGEREPLSAVAARAFEEGRLKPLPRMPTVRPESDYEMDPLLAVTSTEKINGVTWGQLRDAYVIAHKALRRLSLNDEMAGMGQRDDDPEAIARCRYACRALDEVEQAVTP